MTFDICFIVSKSFNVVVRLISCTAGNARQIMIITFTLKKKSSMWETYGGCQWYSRPYLCIM